MKALIRKHGCTPTRVEQDEVYVESEWVHWIDKETGKPLTDENYGYALCVDCPEGVELDVKDFEVTEHVEEVEDEFGEKVQVKSWTAVHVGAVEDGA